MNCGGSVAKYVLLITNLFFVVAGIVTIALGAVFWSTLQQFQDLFPVHYIPVGIIVLGCIIFFISFLACCGAIKESRCMLITYASIMIILTGVKMWLTAVIFGFVSDAQDTVSTWIEAAFNNMDLRPVYHSLEYLFSCCGTKGPLSYGNSTLPASCCAQDGGNSTCVVENAFDGCTDVVVGWFEVFAEAIGGVFSAIVIFELVAITVSIFVSYTITTNIRRYNSQDTRHNGYQPASQQPIQMAL